MLPLAALVAAEEKSDRRAIPPSYLSCWSALFVFPAFLSS